MEARVEKRQQRLRLLQSVYSAVLTGVHYDQQPKWPSLAQMSSWSKRQWEREMYQLRAKLRGFSRGSTATKWLWPADERLGQLVVLGPFSHTEMMYATSLVTLFSFLPARLQRELLACVRPSVRTMVHFMCANQADGDLRRRHFRLGLLELGFVVIYQV